MCVSLANFISKKKFGNDRHMKPPQIANRINNIVYTSKKQKKLICGSKAINFSSSVQCAIVTLHMAVHENVA